MDGREFAFRVGLGPEYRDTAFPTRDARSTRKHTGGVALGQLTS
jgi:hypothetical protein